MFVTKILKSIIGIALLPIVIGISIAFYRQFGNIDIFFTEEQGYFLAGIGTYCLIQLLLFKPVYLYVLGHEAVHVLAAWLCLGRVKSFKVTPAGGSVTTDKTNIFISLSPYFVPVYAIILALVYYFVNDAFPDKSISRSYFMFFLGVMLCFHIVMTVDMLKTRQPDLAKAGYITSVVLIYLVNMLIISGVLQFLFDGFSFMDFLKSAYTISEHIYKTAFVQLFAIK